jgi:mannosyltransferase
VSRAASPPTIDRRLLVGGIIGLAAVLRAAGLGRGELWFDEAYAALLSLDTLPGIIRDLSKDSSPPLYYFVLRAWRSVGGGGPAALRALSAVAGVAAVYLAYRLATLLWNERAGILAGLMLAISPLHLYYSQEIRPYSLFLVFALVALIGLTRLARKESSTVADSALYCAGVFLALYTHNYGLFLLVPLGIEVVARRVRPTVAASCIAIVSAGYAAWIPILLQQVRAGTAVWVARIWAETPPLLAPVKSLAAFSIGGRVPSYVPVGSTPEWLHPCAYVVFGTLVGWAMCSRRQQGAPPSVALWVVAMLGAPYLLSFAVPIYVVGRYDVLALPLFLGLAARGWERLQGRASLIATGMVTLLAVISLTGYYSRPPLQGAEIQATVIAAHAGPRDVVLAMGFTRNPLEYYARERGVTAAFFSFPSSLGDHRGWLDEEVLHDPAVLSLDAARVVDDLASRLRAGDMLWVAHSGALGDAAVVVLTTLNEAFLPVPCAERAEKIGLSCWTKRAEKSRGP